MAVGDDAQAAGYPLVPNTGEEGKVRYGSREINRTRDLIAQLKKLLPIGKAGYRAAAGISYGSANPTGVPGDGDVYFKIVS
jgi:hypothetical protein